jgi:hypothetical protein
MFGKRVSQEFTLSPRSCCSQLQSDQLPDTMEEGEKIMHLPAVILTPKARALLAAFLFLVAWFLGVAAMRGGFNGIADVPATCKFAVACGLWWMAYKISRSANGRGITLGFVALGLWMLNSIGALVLDFHHYVADFFFWASTAIFLLLITAVALSDKPSGRPRTSPTPD